MVFRIDELRNLAQQIQTDPDLDNRIAIYTAIEQEMKGLSNLDAESKDLFQIIQQYGRAAQNQMTNSQTRLSWDNITGFIHNFAANHKKEISKCSLSMLTGGLIASYTSIPIITGVGIGAGIYILGKSLFNRPNTPRNPIARPLIDNRPKPTSTIQEGLDFQEGVNRSLEESRRVHERMQLEDSQIQRAIQESKLQNQVQMQRESGSAYQDADPSLHDAILKSQDDRQSEGFQSFLRSQERLRRQEGGSNGPASYSASALPQQASSRVPELTLKQDPILGTDIQREDEIALGQNTYDINSLTASLLSRPSKKVNNLVLPLDPYTNLPIDHITAHKIAMYYKISIQEFLDFFDPSGNTSATASSDTLIQQILREHPEYSEETQAAEVRRIQEDEPNRLRDARKEQFIQLVAQRCGEDSMQYQKLLLTGFFG